MSPGRTVQERYLAALDTLVEQVKADRSILAVLLCGSLSHDTVWEKSDIDLVFVSVDDKKVEARQVSLWVDGINIHALLMPRAEFRSTVAGALQNSFIHSFLAKGTLLYTHDDTIAALCDGLTRMGSHDRRLQLFATATCALAPIDKAHKWFRTRGDLEYTALWILYAATPLARVEVIGRGLLADREVVPQAMTLNPSFFTVVYHDLLNAPKTRTTVTAALQAVDDYLASRAASLFAPVIDHLREVGEARSASELESHFERTLNLHGVTLACEYLSDRGLIGKAATPMRLTKKSNVDVAELAFFAVDGGPTGTTL